MIKLLSLFSGIGAFEKALTNLGVQYEVVNYCEIDKYASKSYSAIHGIPESKNLWDITKVDAFNLPKDIDLLTYGFPCQDISLAGKQKGMFNEDGTLTRSGLFFKALDIIECVKPKIAIAENVKALTSKKFTEEFKIVLDSLEKAGYHNYWQVLNAKDYGIPQNRERVFIVSIRKDIDHYMFEFPKPYILEKRLKDFLEPYVDEKYYLSDDLISKIVCWEAHQKPFEKVLGDNSISPTLTARGAGENHSGMILYSDALEDTSNLQNYCLQIKEKTKKGYTEAYEGDGVYINRPHQKRGVVQKGMIQTIKTSPDIGVVVKDIAPTQTTYCGSTTSSGSVLVSIPLKRGYIKPKLVGGIGDKKSNGGTQYYQQDRIYDSESIAMAHPANLTSGSYYYQVNTQPLRIRKLTPKECFRLMGFSDEDFSKAEQVPTSNAQLYKQAGNSIVVNVLEEILKELFINEKKPKRQTDQTRYEQLTLF